MSGDALPQYRLRLYVTGSTVRSTRAIANLRRIVARNLDGRYAIEVVDIYADPDSARADQIVAAPTLVRVSPAPVRRIIGDLSDETRVVTALELL